ncbi:MAG: RluA family pseudouridine synthase [Lachnospiraceae bacterium]|nr:RluA family pseudouridine synthase [Lachnospiraceae bacterium]MDD6505639.1 RluA family pseudouridine synthase [Lachnospiraceae bacterium]
MDLQILYEDDAILVCYKPAGIATQTRKIGQQDMESLLRNYRARRKENPYIGVVHRLDQPVEGVMVFAKTPGAAAKLSEQIKNRAVGKHYYAVAWADDYAGEDQGVLEDYLVFEQKSNLTRIVDRDVPGAKKAMLEYRIAGRTEGKLCADILLHTGRHHQIRAQFAYADMPLVGDAKYGKRKEKCPLALCSYRLEFAHPTSGENMDFSAVPKGDEFGAFLDNIHGKV